MKLDKKEYENKNIIITGSGNSSFEIANHLVDTCNIIIVDFKSILFVLSYILL